ncbi:oxidoreductase [Pelobium manganitolerans]|uniref:Oxidoreductase n=1 Tax=Pelobium manganitolerans TaxID=1842495 RepID=A0A419SBB9_9SPHI|nr:Gfo/Idh/MocA family oxidoreductase [Pelobium manganitolerans]RKD20087.1 oxidoreductase [Pelobium manganitolerans]
MMSNPIKTGLLAYGMSGKIFHAPFIDLHDGFELVAVFERTKNNAVADYPNIKTYRSAEELIGDDEIELIIVNTPNYTHYSYAKAALLAGKHVLIEKPFSVNRNEAEELFALAFRKNLKVLAYQNRRFDSDFKTVKNIIDSGRLGKISEAHIRFDRYRNEISEKQFKEDPIPGAGVFYDLGAHIVDQAIALFGIPPEFEKTYAKHRGSTQVDDAAYAHLKYNNGLNVFVGTNMLVVKQQPAYVVYGEKGTLIKYRTDVQEAQLLAGKKPADADYGVENEGDEALLYTFSANGEVVEERIPAEKGNYLELFDEVYNSIRNGAEYFAKQNQILGQLAILEK